MTYVVCPVCKNGRAQIIGWRLICPEGHRLRLVKVENG
jgi:hypothetical protein